MQKNLEYYQRKFSHLRVDRSRGAIAPHKPILLLAIIELIEQGLVRNNRVFLSAELIASFVKYWSHFGTANHNSDVGLPFFHLTSSGFWHLKPNPGFEKVLVSQVKLKTIRSIQDVVEFAFFDRELFELLQRSDTRMNLLGILIQTWFPTKTKQIDELFQSNEFLSLQTRLLLQGGEFFQPNTTTDEATIFVRDAAFRRNVMAVYGFSCAFCGLKILSPLGQNIVDGAHIKPFSKFFDNRMVNGISLCKNHHWAFDRGWFSIDESYRILVSPGLKEESPNSKSIQAFQGELLKLPIEKTLWPDPESLAWHRSNTFGNE